MPIAVDPQQSADNVKTPQQTAGKTFAFIRWYWLMFFLFILGLLALILLNAYPTSTGGTHSPILEADQFPSGALGLTKDEWEKSHVLKVTKDRTPSIYDPHFYDYQVKPFSEFTVSFWPDPQRDTGSLIISGIRGNPTKVLSDVLHIKIAHEQLDQEKMQQAARALMPDDAEFVESGRLPTHRHELIETYHSKLLESRYPSLPGILKPWGENRPGTIHVSYSIYSEVLVRANLVVPPTPEPPTQTPVDTPLPLPTPLPTEIRPLVPTPFGTKALLPPPVPSWSIPTP